MRILIADDDPTYRNLLSDLLTKWRFEPVLAEDGRQAWDILQRSDAPRLVILDWMMPGLDGFEIAKKIRQEMPDRSAYILLITNTHNKQDIMKVLVCGADDYLIKPFDPMDLKIHLRSAMRILNLQEEVESLQSVRSPGLP